MKGNNVIHGLLNREGQISTFYPDQLIRLGVACHIRNNENTPFQFSTLVLMWPAAPRRISFLAILFRPSATAMCRGPSPFWKTKKIKLLLWILRFDIKKPNLLLVEAIGFFGRNCWRTHEKFWYCLQNSGRKSFALENAFLVRILGGLCSLHNSQRKHKIESADGSYFFL